MVYTLCCRSHSLPYQFAVGIDKVHDLVVIFCILIAYSTTLHLFERVQFDFHRFYSSALNGCRKDKRVFFEIVFIREYAMVHCRSFLQMLLHTLQYVDLDCAIRETDTEELGFKFLETLLVLHCLLSFSLYFFFLTLSEKFAYLLVVFGDGV